MAVMGAILATVAACQSDRLTPERIGPSPPPGTPEIAQSVDGLTVGHRLMAAGEYELALHAYYRAAAEQGLTTDVLSAIGAANLKLGRLHQAETEFRAALKQNPNFVPALNNLGVVLMSLGKYSEAKQYFQAAFALDSGHSDLIRENLIRAIALMDKSVYADTQNLSGFDLVRRGDGQYLLLKTK